MQAEVSSTKPRTRVRVLLIEDDPVFAREVGLCLSQSDDFVVIAHAPDYATALIYLTQPHDLAIVDLGLPDGNGIDFVREHRVQQPGAKCMVMTVFESRESVTGALAAGADGYLVKSSADFVEQLRLVAAGEHPLDPKVTGYLLDTVRTDGDDSPSVRKLAAEVELSPREQQTLEALSEGLSYLAIAQRLGVSSHTVPDYIKSLYRKLTVNSRSEAVYQGVPLGLIQIGGR